MTSLAIEYLPIFILSVIAGIAGLIRKHKVNWYSVLEVVTGYGLMGVITLIALNEFASTLSTEMQYATVIAIAYTGVEDALELFLKLKGLKK